MNTKTKAENLRLFEEARSLREKVKSGLHQKATNTKLDSTDIEKAHKKRIKKDL